MFPQDVICVCYQILTKKTVEFSIIHLQLNAKYWYMKIHVHYFQVIVSKCHLSIVITLTKNKSHLIFDPNMLIDTFTLKYKYI